jgi:hypothetical protein
MKIDYKILLEKRRNLLAEKHDWAIPAHFSEGHLSLEELVLFCLNALDEASEMYKTDDVNGIAGEIAYDALRKIENELLDVEARKL